MKNNQNPKGFTKYEVKGNKVYNAKTGNEIAVRDGGKYQLKNDQGVKKNVTLAQLKELLPAATVTKEKTGKATGVKSKKVGELKTENINKKELLAKDDVKEIMAMEGRKNQKILALHKAKYTTQEIMAITDSNYGVVKRDIWRFEKGFSTAK